MFLFSYNKVELLTLTPLCLPQSLSPYPPCANRFSTVSIEKSPPASHCYQSLLANSPHSNDSFMSSLLWWKIPSCPADLNGSFCAADTCLLQRTLIYFAQLTRRLPGSNEFRSLSPKGKWEAATSMWKPHSISWAAWALAVILLTWTGLCNAAVPGWLTLAPSEVKPQHLGKWLFSPPIW